MVCQNLTMGHVITTPEQSQGTNTVVQQHQNNNNRHPSKAQSIKRQQNDLQPTEEQIDKLSPRGKKDYAVHLRQTPKPRPSKQCRRTLSVYDPNTPKGQMAALEKILQGVIAKLGTYMDGRTNRTDIKESIARIIDILRLRMRILRRWRNGSVDYNTADLEEFAEFLTNTRIDVFAIEVQCIQDDLTRIDEFILILDAGANDLRQNVDDDFTSVLNDLTRFQLTENMGSSEKFADDLDVRLAEINAAVMFLIRKISDRRSPSKLMSNGFSSANEDPLARFETNPSRNRVLATADRVRRMLRAFTEGDSHMDLGGAAKTEMCTDNDSEVLRRQLRKIRRWQHNAQRFDSEDVDDLQLIISAIESHFKPSHVIKSPMPHPANEIQFTPASRIGVTRSISMPCHVALSTSVVSLSLESGDLTTDSGVADTDPPSDEVFRDGSSSTTKDGFAEISELEQDEDYCERLI